MRMTDFSKILSGQSKNEIKPQIHDRRTALSQSFPFILVARLMIIPPYESNRQRAETGICCGLSSVRSEVRFADFVGKCPRLHGSFRVDDPAPNLRRTYENSIPLLSLPCAPH